MMGIPPIFIKGMGWGPLTDELRVCVYKRGEAYFKWVLLKVQYGEGEITPPGIEGRVSLCVL